MSAERNKYWANREHLLKIENKLRELELNLERVSQPNLFTYPDAEVLQSFQIRKAQLDVDQHLHMIETFKKTIKQDK